MLKIESVDQLKKESIGGADFGLKFKSKLRLSRHIVYNPDTDTFDIFNLVKKYHQAVTSDTLPEKTIILEAIESGRFFKN